jgi:hypothetical protein
MRILASPARATALVARLPTDARAPDDAQAAVNPAGPVGGAIQANRDDRIWPASGPALRTDIQPVVPLSISEDWTRIPRSILPVTAPGDILAAGAGETGLGDARQGICSRPRGGWRAECPTPLLISLAARTRAPRAADLRPSALFSTRQGAIT